MEIIEETVLKIKRIIINFKKQPNRQYTLKFLNEKEQQVNKLREIFTKASAQLPKVDTKENNQYFQEALSLINSKKETVIVAIPEESEEGNSSEEENLREEEEEEHEFEMATAAQKKEFIGMCASIIRENYDGNPLSLEAFLDKIALIEELVEDNLVNTLISFIKSKLEGKAREALPENVTSINDIKVALKAKIKPENSKVIAGKIAALQVRSGNYPEFTKQAEALADALERSLVIEGISKQKATEMAIEQTVNVCRLNAKTDLVKAILASTAFTDPKEVVAKLVVEQSNENKEKQVLAFNTANRNTRGSYRGRNPHRNFSYNRQNNNNSNNGNYYYRGNYRGNNYRYNNTNNWNNNRGNFNRFSGRGAYVRNLNAETPQQELGDQN